MAEKQVEYTLRENSPLGQTQQSKYFPVLAGGQTMNLRQLCQEISNSTTCTSSDIIAVQDAFVQSLSNHLSAGNRVSIDRFGSFVSRLETEAPIQYTDDKTIAATFASQASTSCLSKN